MVLLHPVMAFGSGDRSSVATAADNRPDYWYEGRCPHTQTWLRLPRTPEAEAIARGLMRHLATDPSYQHDGKMYGVLLVRTSTGETAVLKAFSGLLNGQADVAGWVPPIPGRAQVALLERQTLRQLAEMKQALISLQQIPERASFAEKSQEFADRLTALASQHRQNKAARDRQRQTYTNTLSGESLAIALAALTRQSQHDGGDRRRLKQQRDKVLEPLRATIAAADTQIQTLKRQRQALSRRLQTQMHAAYSLTNFAGETTALQDLWPTGLPTGTGDCAAPKLLHYAATQGLQPLALAEFWWGPTSGDKHPGHFYGACADRCQPIMGFLLSGLSPLSPPAAIAAAPLPILYEDDVLMVVDKPSGLLSVPGRRQDLQDSVVSRLRCQHPDLPELAAVHRLDKGTSGILVIAKTATGHCRLNQQFAQRQVRKTYEAILSRPVERSSGVIDLPLWRDPRDRPKTSVHLQHGKPSLTEFQVLVAGDRPRLRFMPHTGRTHQLRVHAAHPQGLHAPILGDTLYGPQDQSCRLQLHASTLQLAHPVSGTMLSISCPVPF